MDQFKEDFSHEMHTAIGARLDARRVLLPRVLSLTRRLSAGLLMAMGAERDQADRAPALRLIERRRGPSRVRREQALVEKVDRLQTETREVVVGAQEGQGDVTSFQFEMLRQNNEFEQAPARPPARPAAS